MLGDLGVILAGGNGTRLKPLTNVINKHLLPVFNKPMIYYPIEFLRDSGVTNLMIILGGNSVGDFITLLGDGKQLGVNLTYRYQYGATGIAGALKLVKNFVGNRMFTVCLGDNWFSQPISNLWAYEDCQVSYKPTARIFIAPTDRASSFGVPTFKEDKIVKITEKPLIPDSNYAVTGLYQYDKYIWNIIDSLQPSARGELEITDINNLYIEQNALYYKEVEGLWSDLGSIESLHRCSNLIAEDYYANKK